MLTDQIADMFTRIRNAVHAKKKTVTIPASQMKKDIARILFENNFIAKYAFVDDAVQGQIKILLRYDDKFESAIQGIERVSTPGHRQYRGVRRPPFYSRAQAFVLCREVMASPSTTSAARD